ncbi:ABC transporter permease [Aggregicoccus sp. 17bor-14]|uniref:ABC transporter permease n=1 Tax=Myxococcaceae TaxID=31 RepID=UPI00129D0A95|nr:MULTISPECIES: ABC transporter permease [Myxococcaceae]MBF5044308.1 ABC transporter permease [Simulacricoccus sp. 17bor-14]MRI90057.1 ABC transporter permease [Aggregicoccus sp. 17bor-14]
MGERLRAVLPSLLSIALALALGFLAIALTRDLDTALQAYGQMLAGGIGDWGAYLEGGPLTLLTRPWGEAGTKAALLTFTGLSVAVAFRVGLFNIGAQGQMVVGALVAAVVGAQLSLPAFLHLPLALLAAGVAGGLWALLPALLKLRRGVHEVISTIMLNWVAVSLVDNWLVVGPLRASASGELSRSGTDEVLATAELPRLLGSLSRLNLGLPLALLAAALVWLWLLRTRVGYEVRAVGQGAEAARTAGIPVARRVTETMALAGALAGLAGAVLVLGTELKYPSSLGAPYGFDGIAIALLGGSHPGGTAAAALFFGVLRAGGTRMQLLGVHKSFPELIQGLALLLVAGRLAWLTLVRRRSAVTGSAVVASTEVPRA